MGTFKRVKFTTLENVPLQVLSVPNAATGIALVGYRIYNPNTTDVWVGAYNATSGTVTVGTTAVDYGKFLVPAGAERNEELVPEEAPLYFFTNGVTFAATTTAADSGSTSPSLDLTIELFYYV